LKKAIHVAGVVGILQSNTWGFASAQPLMSVGTMCETLFVSSTTACSLVPPALVLAELAAKNLQAGSVSSDKKPPSW